VAEIDKNNDQSDVTRLVSLGPPDKSRDEAFDVERHTNLIKLLRVILPVLALVLVAILIVKLYLDDPMAPVVQDEQQGKLAAEGVVEMINAEFGGVDQENRPYKITAEKAIRSSAEANILKLVKPMADMHMKSGNWVAVEAKSGVFDQEKSYLLLTDTVKMYHDSGYELMTDKMSVDFKKGLIDSVDLVKGFGPMGQVKASGLTIKSTQKRVIFKGPLSVTIFNRDKNKKRGN